MGNLHEKLENMAVEQMASLENIPAADTEEFGPVKNYLSSTSRVYKLEGEKREITAEY